jgi:1-aminocyclopropane-1-carboxylate deaminase/D-cysteine desulfhydrase-like pyridoxal-dependent ACC family enzyme
MQASLDMSEALSARELPRLRLAQFPTPLELSPRLGAAVGCPGLLVKREDLSGLGLGGNKPRQLEVILADAQSHGCDTIVTTAAAQSNFCRATAAACATLGWRCVLLLRGAPDSEVTGNLLLDHLFGAEIHFIAATDPYSDEIQKRLDTLMADEEAAGRSPYLVRLPGVTGPLAAASAAGLADEIIAQQEQPAGWVALAVGSGLTAAGLLAGFARAGHATRVLALSVQQPKGFIEPLILKRAEEALRLLGSSAAIDPTRLVVDDRFIGAGYAVATEGSVAALRLAGEKAGLILDPAYSGKAFHGLTSLLADGTIGSEERVIFVHTGGAPGLFARSEQVAAALAS